MEKKLNNVKTFPPKTSTVTPNVPAKTDIKVSRELFRNPPPYVYYGHETKPNIGNIDMVTITVNCCISKGSCHLKKRPNLGKSPIRGGGGLTRSEPLNRF